MDFLNIIFTSVVTTLLLILITVLALILKIYIGKSIKNPKYPPVVGTIFDQLFNFNRLHDYFADIALKHPTFRILLPDQSELYTTDIRNIEHILRTNFDNYSKGEYNKDVVTDLFGNGIFAVDGAKWKQQRKLASFEFSTRVLRDFSCTVFRENAVKFVRVVSEFSKANKVFDVQNLLMQCTLDSIFKVGFGVDLNCLEGCSEEGGRFIKAFDDSNALIYWRYVDPLWKLKRFLNIGCAATLQNNIKLINDFVLNLISNKREQLRMNEHCNEKEDILSRFLIESKKDPRMNDQYLMDIILSFLIAGKDTSANTLSWFFYMLCKNPLVQEKVVLEMETLLGNQTNGATIESFVDKITDEVLEKMYYLHAALSETLRLYPAVPLGLLKFKNIVACGQKFPLSDLVGGGAYIATSVGPLMIGTRLNDGRVADVDDNLPDGFKLKKGEGVYYMSYAMGRMPYIWGDDAEDFKPERWLNDNGVFQPESPFKFVAFHAGPRICLGKDFAYRQMKIMSIAVLRFFMFKLADKSRKVTYRTMFTLHIDGGLHLLSVPRTSS